MTILVLLLLQELGPEVRLTHDGDFNHWESTLVVDPENPRRLLVSANTHNLKGHVNDPRRWTCSTYRSEDGGRTWTGGPVQEDRDLGDALAVAGTGGRSYVLALVKASSNRIGVWRREAGEPVWSGPVLVGPEKADYQKAAVDRSGGPRHGRLYIHARTGAGRMLLHAGDGTTFRSACYQESVPGGFTDKPLVLADGTLFLPYRSRKTILAGPDGRYAGSWDEIFCLTSTDGGETFTAPVRIARREQSVCPVYGVGRFEGRERIYGLWSGGPENSGTLHLATSDDKGRTWSPPRPVRPEGAVGVGICMLAAGEEGTVGIGWLGHESGTYHAWFSASTDGGATFGRAIRLSTEASGRARYDARYPGGDYTFMDAAPGNVFHVLWPDARSGAYQLYTRTVTLR